MSLQAVLLPLFVEVLLTFGLLVWLGILRNRDLTGGAVKLRDIGLREPNWPPRTLQAAYSFSNQFELPVLFYVLTILVIITRHADLIFVVMAWVFVIMRLAQAYEHTTTNHVRRRGMFYGVAAVVLFLMWAIFAVRILFGLS
jgi:hypothetical protein